ncbi:MAG: hypothetical protein C4530_09560 [Desulfobacteraceae bacterium]|nr:MAG: hypothetical protein C4530_09560 [Desulfobacteraceae bacterium]
MLILKDARTGERFCRAAPIAQHTGHLRPGSGSPRHSALHHFSGAPAHRCASGWRIFSMILLLILSAPAFAASESAAKSKESTQPEFSIPGGMGEAVTREAERVKEELRKSAESLFVREPLGWDFDTIRFLYHWIESLPSKFPDFKRYAVGQTRRVGAAGSVFVFTFLLAVFYSIAGRKRMQKRVEDEVGPLKDKIPGKVYPYLRSILVIVTQAVIPIILLLLFAIVDSFILFRPDWFQLIGRLLILWLAGALGNGILREFLTRESMPEAPDDRKKIYRPVRWALIYAMLVLAVYWCAEIFPIRKDVLALLRFVIAISIVIVMYFLLLKKEAFLSLLPGLSYRGYQGFVHFLYRYYRPLISFSFVVAILWCLGYERLGKVVLVKIWASAAVFVTIMIVYHRGQNRLRKWSERVDSSDEPAQFLLRASKALLLYSVFTITCILLLNLLGLLEPLQRLMSFTVFELGDTPVTCWTIVKAFLILFAFIFASRLLQAYMDYRIYPALGIDPGLGYALNTFFKYATLAIGVLVSLRIVGIDLRLLLVFAGAVGIGIGLGLQNMAANVISGFAIIFGGKIRKGDWIETGDTLGIITDIYLRATRVRTRDNIEYLIPNSELISSTIVNYSLSSPMIRMEVPVGVSYDSDPREVEKILLQAAEKESLVEKYPPPAVRFRQLGDSSLDFGLLIWIDVRNVPRRKVRSNLYFSIFQALKDAGIEIPFPQRDIHIRTNQQVEPIPKAGIKSDPDSSESSKNRDRF